MPLSKLASIVLAAQPGTAVYFARYGGWTPTDHLIATQMEQNAGLVSMTRRMPREGVAAEEPKPVPQNVNPNRIDSWDSYELEEFERMRAENYAKGLAPSRVIRPEST